MSQKRPLHQKSAQERQPLERPQQEQAQKRSRILVIGGAGYIGSRLVPELLKLGSEVTVLDTFWFGDYLPKEVIRIKKNAEDCVEDDFKGFETVIFLAGLSNDPMAEFDPKANFFSNGPLPTLTALLAKKAGVKKYVYASTASVYGFSEGFSKESDFPKTDSFYGISKLQGEIGVIRLATTDFQVVALRQGTVCGSSPRMRYDLLLNTMYMTAASQGVINVRNPSIWRPILFIEDSVECFIHAVRLTSKNVPAFSVNVSSFNTTLSECAVAIQAHFWEKHQKHIPINFENLHDPRNYKLDTSMARQLSFPIKPTRTLKEVIQDIEDHVGLEADFGDDKGYNIRVFQNL